MFVCRRSFTFKLMVVDDHIGRSRWKMDAAFPILARTSGSESPSLAYVILSVIYFVSYVIIMLFCTKINR